MTVGDAVTVKVTLADGGQGVVPARVADVAAYSGVVWFTVVALPAADWRAHESHFGLHLEGITWARGHDTDDARALEARVRLLA